MSLKDEIAKLDPALPPAAMAAALNTLTRRVPAKVATGDIKKYLFLSDLLLPLQAAATAGKANAMIALAALDSFDSLDTDDPAVLAKMASVLDALVGDGLIGAKDRDAVMSLTAASVPILGAPVTPVDVAAALEAA